MLAWTVGFFPVFTFLSPLVLGISFLAFTFRIYLDLNSGLGNDFFSSGVWVGFSWCTFSLSNCPCLPCHSLIILNEALERKECSLLFFVKCKIRI